MTPGLDHLSSMALSVLLFHSYTDLRVCSSVKATMRTELSCILLESSHSREVGSNSLQTLINVMYAYIDRKKKLPCNNICLERLDTKQTRRYSRRIFGLAEDVKVRKSGLKKAVGRKAGSYEYLRSWIEDFVDEDTGEVVSIERNEVDSGTRDRSRGRSHRPEIVECRMLRLFF